MTTPPFANAHYIWTQGPHGHNQFALFTRSIPCPPLSVACIRVFASYEYELYVNGEFTGRGPVYGDPQWVQYDEYVVVGSADSETLDIAAVVHHSDGIELAYQIPAPAGFIADITINGLTWGTGTDWRGLNLTMWEDNVPRRGWALDYAEEYYADREPAGWATKRWSAATTADWPSAVLVENAETVWGTPTPRMLPLLDVGYNRPTAMWAWKASREAEPFIEASCYADEEDLTPVREFFASSLGFFDEILDAGANAFTFDLGEELAGHFMLSVFCPAGITIDISGAELLQPGTRRPWVYRKGTRYTARLHTKNDGAVFRSWDWMGCRYLHVVFRNTAERIPPFTASLAVRGLSLPDRTIVILGGAGLVLQEDSTREIVEICRRTLQVCAQEHLIDCPTREQTQYWGDGVFIAQSLYRGFGEASYLQFYLECFLRVPFQDDGQISCKYPGQGRQVLLDYSLVPLIGQAYHKANTGAYYKPEETAMKALRLLEWYDRHTDEHGLVSFPFDDYFKQGRITFIDHPGIGWHDFPHVGIDRDGTSCPLNAFLYGFLRILADLCRDAKRHEQAGMLSQRADHLAQTLRDTFWGGELFHDAIKDEQLSPGTSWQTNCLLVFFDIVTGADATQLMRTILDGYDRRCRCSPYFHFYLLPALRKADMEREAVELVLREWQPMLDAGATTAWEGFLGDAKDSLCHPWSTAPLLFLHEATGGGLHFGPPS